MEFTEYLPFWNQLTSSQQLEIQKEISFRKAKKGTPSLQRTGGMPGSASDPSGTAARFFFSLQKAGRSRLPPFFPETSCLFSASCMMRSIQFELSIERKRIRNSG